MTPPPARPKIYHITHVDNLPGIIRNGGLLSDATISAQGGPAHTIGMSSIKSRRIDALPVYCQPGTMVGDYVPFYFCPRSVMLYVIHRANHQELTYRGGQGLIVHLESDLHQVVQWADARRTKWAFSLANAGANLTQFRRNIAQLNQLNWAAIYATNWSAPDVKEGKQAEFLVHASFPWDLVTHIGAHSEVTAQRALTMLRGAAHRPVVEIKPTWYY